MKQVKAGEYKRHKGYSEKIWCKVNFRVPGGEEREDGTEAIHKDLKTEVWNPWFEETQQSPRKIHKKKSTTRHTEVKLQNSKTEQNPKSSQRKKLGYPQRSNR